MAKEFMEENLNEIIAKPLGTLSSDELSIIRQIALHFPDGIRGAQWGSLIVRAVEEEKAQYGPEKALKLVEEAYNELDRVYPQMFDEKSTLLKSACLYCLEGKDQETAHKKMEEYLNNALAQVHYRAKNETMPYYSFRGFSEYSLKDIENETISMAHPREFNDPLDTILVYWLEKEIKNAEADDIQLHYRLLMKKVAEHIKIRCLIAGEKEDGNDLPVEELNILMWSHYANSHKGFCVRYEFDRDLFDIVENKKKKKILLVDGITYSKSIDLKDEPSIRMALLEKSDFWKYEREMRLLSFDWSGEDKEFPTIASKGAAKAVYLGARCTDANRRAMEKAIGDKNIPLYQMSVDEAKLTRFKKTLIG